MDFGLTEEQTAIFDMAYAFGQSEIAPYSRQWEKDETIPKALWPKVAELGLGGIYVSDEYGGSGLSRLDATLVFEALAMACPAVGSFLSIHNMCAGMIDKFGSDEMKAEWLPRLCSMETFISYCLTEPGSGSDAAALRTKAARTNEGYELTGTKAFISGGGYSDAYVVMCRTGDDSPRGVSAMIIEDGAEGLSFGGLEDKMGWRAQPTAQVQFDDAKVPTANLIGEEGRGFAYAMAGLDGGRLNIAASALGGAQAALNATLIYMGERKAFGKTIDQFQGLQFRLADMETELSAARVFLRQAAWKLDNEEPDATKFCAMAKRFVTDAAFNVANDALQLHGGYGYLADYGVEKIVRDLRVHQILEGTNEIMRVIISRAMLAERNDGRAA
jgi:alkylation response protein AidB-like acyl-CoA dehydrogenase